MLEIRNVRKTYGQKEVLHGINLTLTTGVYGLLGPNGAGKSTLMNIISDNLNSSEGTVLWDGVPTHELGIKYRRILGYAPQQNGLYDDFRADMFLDYIAVLKEIPKEERKQKVERVLKLVHLSEFAHEKLGGFSGGMKQRMMIAQALLKKPKLLILDEPTAGLDPKERIRIRQLVEKLADECIVIFATHVVADIESIAKEIIVVKAGNVVAQKPPQQLIEQYPECKTLEDVYMHIFQDEEQS